MGGDGKRRGLRRFFGPRRALLLAVFAAAVVGAWYLRKAGVLDPAFIRELLEREPVAAPVVFVLAYGLAVMAALPTLPINLAAGLFWGPVWGGVVSACGGTLGALAAFAVTRGILGRPLAGRFDNELIAEVQREFESRGWWFVAFVRLNPIFPTGPLNYVFGLTSIGTFTYAWATFVFLVPPGMAVSLIGHGLGTFVVEGEASDSIRTILMVSAGITVLAALAYAAHLLKRARVRRTQMSEADRP